ncbi:MAG: hypothetical protein RLZ32_1153, partial [Gemmatimonadota bacterium]
MLRLPHLPRLRTTARAVAVLGALAAPPALAAQGTPAAGAPASPPQAEDARVHALVAAASASRIERDIRTLVGFGTRHTLSDTLSATRGIGAARRWIHAEFTRISAACGG